MVAGAAGTAVPPSASVLLHGEWSSAAKLCGLGRPPPALLAGLILLAALALPPGWRALRAGRAACSDGVATPARVLVARRLGAWRLADVLSAALLVEVLLLPAVGEPLMASQLGGALRRFAGIEGIEWHASWGPGAWMLLAAALADAAGRLVTS